MKVFLLLLGFTFAFAQTYSGSFIADGTDVLTLTQHPDGSLTGQIISGDIPFSVEGQVSEQGALGILRMVDGNTLAFGAIFLDNETLNFQMAPVDASGQPIMEQAFELNFIRQPEANPLTLSPVNPLTETPSASPRLSEGQTISSAEAGFSIRVPDGYSTTYDAQNGVMAFSGPHAFVLFAFSKGDMQVMVGQLIRLFKQRDDTQITIIGTPVETTDTFRATLSVIDSSEIVVEIAARQGPAGNVLGIVGSSLPQDTGLGQAIDTALASLSFTPPTANSQVSQTFQFLAGTDLSKAGNSSTFGSGINAPSLSSLDEEFYTFCSNGDYGYSMSSQTFFSSDAGGFSSEDSDQHQGRWEVVAGIAGEPYLFLQASDGRFFLNPVGIAEEIVIGSSVFSSASSDQCQ